MLKGLFKTFVVGGTMLCAFTACEDDDGIDITDINVPDGYALSADISTIYKNSSTAYDVEANWVSGTYLTRFQSGNALYDNAISQSGGLGPVYAGYSCASCHLNAGRTKPSTWTQRIAAQGETYYDIEGNEHVGDGTGKSLMYDKDTHQPIYGSGATGFSSMLVYITRKNGSFFPDYGRVLHDQAIYGVKPEGKLNVTYTYETGTFPDGETYQLALPHYTITEWYTDGTKNYGKPTPEAVKPEDLFCTVRIPLRHVGMGPMMALDPTEIEALAAKSNYPEYGISGRCNYVTERGVYALGVSGNKAQHQDLTVELGFSSDMGVTNSRYPEEICEGQSQMQGGSMMGLTYDLLDVSTDKMEDVDLYMQCLGVPARRLGSTTTKVSYGDQTVTERELVSIGEQNFYKAKCHLCHVTTLHTKKSGSTLLNGTHLPWLGGLTIHPYSDYLLHDMGSEIMGVGLNDNYVSGLARGNEWRTTPLWGIGLQGKVNAHTYFLHDGRARNFVEAIMWHGGEGEASKNLFKNMEKKDRDALVKFLESL